MAEHLTKEQIDQYQSSKLSAQELFNCDIHLADCPDCREKVCGEGKMQSLTGFLQKNLSIIAAESSDHLTFEQMVSYVNKKIDEIDRECIDSHLSWCDDCSADVKDMLSFADRTKENFEIRPHLIKLSRGRIHSAWQRDHGKLPFTSGKTGVVSAVISISVIAVILISVTYGFLQFVGRMNNSASNEAEKTGTGIATISKENTYSQAPSNTPAINMQQPQKAVEDERTSSIAFINAPGARQSADSESSLLNELLRTDELIPEPLKNVLSDLVKTRMDASMGRKESEETFNLISPADDGVREVQPELVWQKFKDGVLYIATVRNTVNDKILYEAVVSDTKLVLPVPLERGKIYSWQVSTNVDNDKKYGAWSGDKRAYFYVTDEKESKLVFQAEEKYKGDKEPVAHLYLALRYTKAGLINDAKRELKSYLLAKPNSSEAIKLLEYLDRLTTK